MKQVSAGILLYRYQNQSPEFFLVHPGGPFFTRKNAGYWTIPKGEPDPQENLLECARREFVEETGYTPGAPFQELLPVRQKGGKLVYCWLAAGDLDPELVRSNTFEMIWPPGSGNMRSFPEIDRAGWFNTARSIELINVAQRELILQANELLQATNR